MAVGAGIGDGPGVDTGVLVGAGESVGVICGTTVGRNKMAVGTGVWVATGSVVLVGIAVGLGGRVGIDVGATVDAARGWVDDPPHAAINNVAPTNDSPNTRLRNPILRTIIGQG